MNDNGADLELLAKLEEKNRLLMADAKAVSSLNPRRRNGSISSSISTESSTDNTKSDAPTFSSVRLGSSSTISVPSVISWGHNVTVHSASASDQWSNIVNSWDQFSKKRSFIADLIRKDLPDKFRPIVWQLFTGAYDSAPRKMYDTYLTMQSPVEKAIRRDITRTFPKHDFFKDEDGYGQECLFRVIKAYSIYDKEVGYCQGSGFIAGLLLMQLPEADAFAVLVQLMNEYRLREMYKPSMAELGLFMYQTERLLAEHLPELYTHFVAHSFGPSLYASAWFLTLFSTVLPIPMATRIMDYFIAEGFSFIFKLVLALLKFSADKLLHRDMESMVAFLQHDGPISWEHHSAAIFEYANSFKLNAKKMKKLEKEYAQLRSQEKEDRTELRRLRTENGLLVQRLLRLEEECNSMADRLIQSQLVRAQEAETMLALRCELSVLKRTKAEHSVLSNDNHRSSSISDIECRSLECGSAAPVNGTTAVGDSMDPIPNGTDSHTEQSDSESAENCNGDLAVSIANEVPSVCPSPPTSSKKYMPVVNMLGATQSDIIHSITNHKRRSTLPRQNHLLGESVSNSDSTLMTTHVHHLHTDLSMCRAREAEARTELLDLKARYHELEQLKCDLAAKSSDQISALNDELFGSRIREAEALARLDEFRARLVEIDSAWQAHCAHCKMTRCGQAAKRSALKPTPMVSACTSNECPQKLSDMVLEARYADQVATLKRQVNELAIQREVADRRADRLDQRVTELIESRSAADARAQALCMELKQAVQMCADTEAKRRTDGVMWRSREMELTAQLTECRHNQLQAEYRYEGLLVTRSLQSTCPTCPRGDFEAGSGLRTKTHIATTTDTSRSHFNETHRDSSSCGISITETENATPPSCSPEGSSRSPVHSPPSHFNKGVTAMWKDLPPTVMTDSIGPLEDLCLIPDDPFITSVYVSAESASDL